MKLTFWHCRILTIFSLAPFLVVHGQEPGVKLNLHVPSPDWEDQVIYFLMTDRFNDGDPSNNDQGQGEYGPDQYEKYSGGDLQGVIDQLDYIRNLGATAVWITPPVANQWWDGTNKLSGYHGYWAEHFKEVDQHLGTIVDFQHLSHELHERGMYLIQDIVINHTGNFYLHNGPFNPADPAENFVLNRTARPATSPRQYPFSLNDVRDPLHRNAGIYHWTPDIVDFSDPDQRVSYELGSLDDINTANVLVRKVFRDSYGYWIRVVGVDGFRIDTVIYVEKDFWNDFMRNRDADAPGMEWVARETGRDQFIAFGEAFLSSEPQSDQGDREVAGYMGSPEKPGLNSMLNFPLYFGINRVFSQGKPTSYLGYRLNAICNAGIYPNPHTLVNFIDNHDTDRFLNNTTVDGLKQALFFQFSIPGIPVIYMGTEQLFGEPRASLFARGWGAEGKDHFNQNSEMYLFVQKLANIRKASKILTRGDLTVLKASEIGAGPLVFSRKYEEQTLVVFFNTAEERILLSNLETGLPAGSRLQLVSGLHLQDNLQTGAGGRLTVELPSRAAGIFQVKPGEPEEDDQVSLAEIHSDVSGKTYTDDILLQGKALGLRDSCLLVVDGKLESAIHLQPGPDSAWQVNLPISRFAFGRSQHELTLYLPGQGAATPSATFFTELAVQGREIMVTDPAGDDHGPAGVYITPADESYGSQMDLRVVKATSFGGNLQIELTMAEVSRIWLPPNGFDHVLFHVFIDLPGTTGNDYLPMLHTTAPAGFAWDYTAYVAGWHGVYYSAEGADREDYGRKLAYTPAITVDPDQRKITLRFTPDAFGNIDSLEGAKIYITTWDSNGGEGGYRGITKEGATWRFGGSDAPRPVRIMDDSEVIEINE